MDLFWDINLEEMLGDLVVTTFIILLAVSLAVVSLMILLPLIDLAFEKKPAARPNNLLIAQDESWRAGRPWLLLRSNFFLKLMSRLPHPQRKHLKLVHDNEQFPEGRHRTPLIKRAATTGTQTETELIVPDKGARPNRASTPSNAA
jgi:hypothetical protein